MTALIPVWLDLPVTLLECDSKGVLPVQQVSVLQRQKIRMETE